MSNKHTPVCQLNLLCSIQSRIEVGQRLRHLRRDKHPLAHATASTQLHGSGSGG